jgi:zinc/manganese transport system permease protein
MPLVASVVGAANGSASWSWNLPGDVRNMFAYPFMVNAFRAGTIVAILGAIVGWYMVLRKQTFAGHTLSVAAFPGAAAATLIGISASVGYFAFCLVAALVIAIASRPSRGRGFSAESAVVGTVQAFVLASGYLFATLYNGLLSGLNNQLFGFTFGITDDQVVTLAAVAVVVLAVLAVIGRRLFFASIDTDVADARGVGVRLLGVVFAFLVMPAAVAQRVTARPVAGIALAVLIGVVATWGGLTMAYYTSYPSGFCITSFAFAAFIAAHRVRASA